PPAGGPEPFDPETSWGGPRNVAPGAVDSPLPFHLVERRLFKPLRQGLLTPSPEVHEKAAGHRGPRFRPRREPLEERVKRVLADEVVRRVAEGLLRGRQHVPPHTAWRDGERLERDREHDGVA